MTWILVLTLIYSEAPSVTSVPGFSSEAACSSAGAAWASQTQDKMPRNTRTSFVCVKSAT